MDKFNQLFNAIREFCDDDTYLKAGVGGGFHPGTELFDLAISARRELQEGGLIPTIPPENEELAEKLISLSDSGWMLNDDIRVDLKRAAKALV
ncbi:hypothetical protein HUO09_17720 [Vibrio sp. Y2-5]|uniref:hypothetical protein n=1 Tax=Vibrio sp. Y2-5 TaxID=2743977 RepID=UPI0016616E5E|nr:hypothetical protein [Vibrio sp. Y2-5]MBD0788197.1 hypothetical protein [Vibrio sp. Y2-5]